MSRSARLLDLLQMLRRHRQPVSGRKLARELGVSLRTVYRDIQTLSAQGARIDGEAGIGFILRPGFLLPPLMLNNSEAEALTLGLRWVAAQGDAELALAATEALAKIAAVLPADLAARAEKSPLMTPRCGAAMDLGQARRAMREERVALIAYADAAGTVTDRRIWPIALGFFDDKRMLAAYCELRGDFRHFRLDRIIDWLTLEEKYPRRRRTLTRQWREQEGVATAPPAMLLTKSDSGRR